VGCTKLSLVTTRTRQLHDEVLEQVSPEEIEAAWAVEITRRAKDVLEGRSKGRPADDVFRDLEARLKSRH